MNRIISLFIIIYLGFIGRLYGQFPKDTLLLSLNERKIYYDDFVYIFKSSGGEFALFKDTLDLNVHIPKFHIKSYIFDGSEQMLHLVTESNNSSIISLEFINDKLSIVEFSGLNNVCIYEKNAYFFDVNTQELIRYDIFNREQEILSITKIFNKPEHIYPLFLAKLNYDSTLICTGYFGDGEYYSVEYYLLNENSRRYRKIFPTSGLDNILNGSVPILNYYSIEKDFAFFLNGIMDSNYRYYSNCLNKTLTVKDIVIKENKIIQLLILSFTDKFENKWSSNPVAVLIPYDPDPFLENLMYKLYHNELLNEEEAKEFDSIDLDLMRNMIYAKYNYAFENEFLTAYFNLYSFYENGRGNRVKNVDIKLTNIDKKNLELLLKLMIR